MVLAVSDMRILVVDDEPDARQFLAACISDAGFKVDTATDVVEALEKVSSAPPDLITLDMAMPRKSGTRFMLELKKDEATASIPVIVITDRATDKFGNNVVMVKPIARLSLIDTITQILMSP